MKDKNRIQVLPDHVANKIAAGEVVERPASVLKELLENAIDADATQIDVETVAGGKTLIRVSDNGVGMDRNNALLCIERFATSKIRNVDEIERIVSLGFRGEALAAISSVSRFSIRTRKAQDLAGTEIMMSAGKIQEVRDQGCAPGTVVSVRNLFFNVPARRKFVRSQQTELYHIRQVFMLYALSHPEIAMTLSIDSRKTVNLPGHSGIDQRLHDLYPARSCLELRRMEYTSSILRIYGYASLPTHTRSDRSEQYLFVNGRPTGTPVLGYAVREAYRGLLPKNRYPLLFLFIAIEPALVDVNVHPTKKEVRFHNPTEVKNATIQAIRKALSDGASENKLWHQPHNEGHKTRTGQKDAATLFDRQPDATRPHTTGQGLYCNITSNGILPGVSYPRMPHSCSKTNTHSTENAHLNQGSNIKKESQINALRKFAWCGATDISEDTNQKNDQPPSENDSERPWPWIRIIGQACGTYILMETEEGLVLMDPHAAHERVMYEKLIAGITKGQIQSHALLLPETVELTPRDALMLRNHIEMLKKIGFGIDEFGGDTFVVDALPACISGISPTRLLTDLASSIAETGESKGVRLLLEERIAQAACKSAVKARNPISERELEKLISELSDTEMPYTCPHGRPTLIYISRKELDKQFGRS